MTVQGIPGTAYAQFMAAVRSGRLEALTGV
jgi:hypothetical protein